MLWYGMPSYKMPGQDAKPDVFSCTWTYLLASSFSLHICMYPKAVDTLHLMINQYDRAPPYLARVSCATGLLGCRVVCRRGAQQAAGGCSQQPDGPRRARLAWSPVDSLCGTRSCQAACGAVHESHWRHFQTSVPPTANPGQLLHHQLVL